ncbi:RidA family protein [[Flexibacter] sp. ATCC 35208]|uniref:RidA family protein n=1 Tax=[Flexibacter] sp. ATCC 35208 TaxID=1936242 RepID=UPI0009D449E9|nr:RidA family protein [[Flexibacter] sp. ATCC 35208]OMP77913.1 hypothetical protein BW716_17715 [[Flexibacter] sp. ATCC 35208]
MSKLAITTLDAPLPGGKYSQAIKVDNWVFLSGQLPFNVEDMTIETECPHNMYRKCFRNLEAVCKAAGGTLDHIVKLNVYYTDISYSPYLDEVLPEFFTIPYPARIRLAVKEISKGAKIEIDAIMFIGNDQTNC